MRNSTSLPQAPLRLFNSLTRQIEDFAPIHPGEARVYSCGPTVYNYPHIGNMRAYVCADLLGRVLTYKGYKLTHIINITDVGHLTDDGDSGEDKLEKAAVQKSRLIHDIARYYTEAFWRDITALNIRQPAHWPAASDYVAEMIAFAVRIAEPHCYLLPSGLYFDISTIADYGRLARRNFDILGSAGNTDSTDGSGAGGSGADGSGAGGNPAMNLPINTDPLHREGRIDPVAGKRNAADFAIWRRTPPDETRQMEWDSPWGRGAPGWHLECSVMSESLLGFPFDIHTGGIDHREIHHPNEIAQNQAACAHSGAQLWMHNNFLLDHSGETDDRSGKMSKSSGEFLRLQRLIDRGFAPMAYRLLCLQAHYRSELEFSWNGLQAALTRLKRLVIAVDQLIKQTEQTPPNTPPNTPDVRGGVAESTLEPSVCAPPPSAPSLSYGELHPKLETILCDFDKAIAEDLNSPLALSCLEKLLAVKKVPPSDKRTALTIIDNVLGLGLLTLRREALRVRPKNAKISEEEIAEQCVARQTARAHGDYALADSIRDALARAGVALMDGEPLGWDWQLGLE